MMEWEPTLPVQSQVNGIRLIKQGNVDGYPSTRPEDQPLVGKRAKWISKEEIETRRRDRRCLRCGRTGCRIATCPLAAAIRPAQIANIATSSDTVVTKTTIEEDYEHTELEQ